ncbi:MAG: sigma-70 family RNA polymerase sigma factor [Saprospirales bacterium]|nr:MAG: sigma-70 family RNA polymerase sigma factor [Saprospirales bacterium]
MEDKKIQIQRKWAEQIKVGGSARQIAARELYEFMVERGVPQIIYSRLSVYGANFEDAEDMFHESLIVLLDKIKAGQHQDSFDTKNYLISIAKNIWRNRLKKMDSERKYEQVILSSSEIKAVEPQESLLILNERSELLQTILNKLSEQCRSILALWMQDFSMRDIATKMSLSSEKIARKYKYRCHKKLVEYLYKNPALTQQLIN